MRIRSLRLRLALTYAGIALLTAVILGGIMLLVLGNYYSGAEDDYLRAGAKIVTADPPDETSTAALTAWVRSAAVTTQTRVRLYGKSGTLLADSGSPDAVDTGVPLGSGNGPGSGGAGQPGGASGTGEEADGEMNHDRLPDPLGHGLFGSSGGSRSSRVLTVRLTGGMSVKLSEAPVSGHKALLSAALAWLLAAALAVALAALAGHLMSRRISRPIVALTEASDQMAEGDLGARAPAAGDDEVGRLAASFNVMAERVEGTVTSLRRFVADAAHEIGTPLTALQADLELAERKAGSEDEHRLVDRALAQTDRLAQLSGSLLQLSRLEAGEPAGEREVVDLAQVAREVGDGVASRAEQAGITLTLSVADIPLPVAGERSRLQNVLVNLLDNAIKFTPTGGSVTLTARLEGDDVVTTVADTGVGIPAEDQAGVFGRFHRGRNAAARPGSGLGLAIVKATIERYGGAVSFTSSDVGTEFRVSLPAAAARPS